MAMRMVKDIHMSGKEMVEMLMIRPGDIGKYAILTGPADRRDAVIKFLANPIKNFSFFEYSMFTGALDGIKVSAMNSGRFSGDSAIGAEIACEGGVNCIIRAGSCGVLDENIEVGEVIIVTDVIRDDGVTPHYVEKSFKTKADGKVVEALKKACDKLKIKYRVGPIWTTDALLRETRETVEKFRSQGAIAVDMVTSTLLTIAQLKGVKAGSITAVSDNVITGEMGFINPKYYDAESNVVKASIEAVKILEGK